MDGKNHMKIETVSIIAAVFNTETYLEKCLSSLVKQSFADIEIILVDDGSIDESGKICDDYARNDSRVRVIHQRNQGVSAARKAGLAIASGEYVCFVDSDDYLELDCIEMMYNEIVRYHVDFMHFGFIQRNTEGNIDLIVNFPELLFRFDRCDEKEKFLRRYVLDITSSELLAFSVWSKIFKRDFIHDVYSNIPNYIKLGEDALCFVYAIKNCSSFAAMPIAKYNYMIRGESASHLIDIQYRINAFHFAHELLLACDKCGFLSLNDVIIRYFQALFYNADRRDGLSLRKYIFPDKCIFRNKKIYIYGAGVVGRDFYDDFSQDTGIDLLGIVDRDWQTISLNDIEVQPVDQLQKAAFDYVVIAVYSPAVTERIVQHLCQMGISKEKIVYQRPKRILDL